MTRLIAAGVALLGLATACAGESEQTAPTPQTPPPHTTSAEPPQGKPLPPPPPKAQATKVLVTVVDGDTHRRVKGARVVIGKRAGYADARGLAKVKIKRRAALPVRVSKPGYAMRVVRMPFKEPAAGDDPSLPQRAPVDDVRREPPPNADPHRHQAPAAVQGRLVTRCRGADRVSGGRQRRCRVHRQLQRHDLRTEHAQRQADLDLRPGGREDGVVARDRRPESRRARDGRRRSRPRPRQRPAPLEPTASALRSSPRRSSAAGSTTSARGTAASTRSTWSGGGSGGATARATRSPRAPQSPARRCTSATTAAGCMRSRHAPASGGSCARSTAASTARPRSPQVACSFPPRPATA